jgi:hypothetical protein
MTFSTVPEGEEPLPTGLDLWINPGVVSFDALHKSGFYAGQLRHEEATWAPSSQLIFGVYPPTIANGWQFRTRPYKAVFARDGSGGDVGYRLQSRIEVIVEHTPD